MPFLRRPRGSLSTPCAGLQPLQLHENRAIPEPWSLNEFAGEADQDRPRDGEHSRPHQQRAEVVVPRPMFYDICGCRSTAGTAGGGMREPMGRQARVVRLDEGKFAGSGIARREIRRSDRHRGWLRSNFLARERQAVDHRPITQSIGCRIRHKHEPGDENSRDTHPRS